MSLLKSLPQEIRIASGRSGGLDHKVTQELAKQLDMPLRELTSEKVRGDQLFSIFLFIGQGPKPPPPLPKSS